VNGEPAPSDIREHVVHADTARIATVRRRLGTSTPRQVVAVVLVSLLAVTACSSPDDGSGPEPEPEAGETACPTTVDADEFASAADLRDLLAEFNRFGLRSPGSEQHEASLDWLADELADVPDMEIEWDEYAIDRWQPTPDAPGDTPGRDLEAAGGLTVVRAGNEEELPVIGAVPFSLPTTEEGSGGPLAFIPLDQEITAANAAGKVVVREIPHSSIPYPALSAIGHEVTDDLPTEGDYDRPYTRPLDKILTDAGKADAAGVVLVWDAPTDQLRGYWDPHTGTRFHVPAVYAGLDQLAALKELASSGAPAQVVVRAEWDVAPTRNLIATLPGRSRERIVVNTNTDSVNWVQENGVVAALALARYLGGLPDACRRRDVQFALTTNHLGFTTDGTFRYGPQLDEDMDAGTVAFVMAIEHLGAREILPTGPDNRLELTGKGDMFAWSAPEESPVLVEASLDAVERRDLDRTAVLKGVGAPSGDHLPSICSQGGLGTNFHGLLVPTIAGISGPWSLWAPAFGEDAIDFDRMRDQALAFGDVAVELDDVDRDEIAGGYLAAREQRAQGAATCDLSPPPAVAPTG
jgi:hypothetical protein